MSYQIFQMWEIARLEAYRKESFLSATIATVAEDERIFDSEFLYSLIHLCLVFFFPAIIIFVISTTVLSYNI